MKGALVARESPQIFPSCFVHQSANINCRSWNAMSRRVRLIAGTTGLGTEIQFVSFAVAVIIAVSVANAASTVWLTFIAEERWVPRRRNMTSPISHDFHSLSSIIVRVGTRHWLTTYLISITLIIIHSKFINSNCYN